MNKIFTEDLSKTFITDGIKNSVLRDINFSISQGESCSIIGASGCGKSTFLHLLAKLDDYSSGRIFFNEINYSDLNSDSSARLRLDNFGFVYQVHHLLEDFNAFDNCKIVQDLILNISRNNEIGIILATHDLNFANMMDTVYEIFDGGLRKVNE